MLHFRMETVFSRIIVQHMPHFKGHYEEVVLWHVPHRHSEESAKKSNLVSLKGKQFSVVFIRCIIIDMGP